MIFLHIFLVCALLALMVYCCMFNYRHTLESSGELFIVYLLRDSFVFLMSASFACLCAWLLFTTTESLSHSDKVNIQFLFYGFGVGLCVTCLTGLFSYIISRAGRK
ncbi:TPA: hypothetical protein P5S08_003738 [Salmonella enterica subsp. enterica serovar Concord]|nr:hypothetical protein [Salmonella enterica subsp. enterica serovar Concord]